MNDKYQVALIHLKNRYTGAYTKTEDVIDITEKEYNELVKAFTGVQR